MYEGYINPTNPEKKVDPNSSTTIKNTNIVMPNIKWLVLITNLSAINFIGFKFSNSSNPK